MKKSFNLAILAALLLTASLTGCKSEIYKTADRFARQFTTAWCAGDSAQVRSIVAGFNAFCDSVQLDEIDFVHNEFRDQVKQILGDSASRRDAVIGAEFATARYDDICLSTADRITAGLLSGDLSIDAAMNEVNATRAALVMLGQPQTIRQFHAATDLSARKLPLDKQMRLFSSVASPEALGRALRADLNAPQADSALVTRQVNELRKIYSDQDYQLFLRNFNPNR